MSEHDHFVCRIGSSGCQSYGFGHHTHWIHAKHAGRAPWGWRDGIVSGIDGRWVTVDYVDSIGRVRLWHHVDLASDVGLSEPVRVHEGYHLLGGPFGWVNVLVQGGVGPVPEPADASTWAAQTTGAVVDLATGRAIALDWLTTDEP